jgi:hypothetical protein
MVGGRRPARRKLVWATDSFNAVVVGAGAKLPQRDLLANLEVAGSSILGATIMRTHSKLSFSEATADTGQGCYAGFIVNSAPTVTNLDPSSAAAFGDDWMLHTALGPPTALQWVVIGTTEYWGYDLDIRAKRRIEELSEKYWLTMINAGSGSVTIGGFTKTLLALP